MASLKRKAFRILLDDLNRTFYFNLTFFWHVLKISTNCFLLCKDILPKYSKHMKISLLSDILFDGLDGINNLSRNFFMQLSIKNSGNEFLCQIDFKNSIS